MVAARLSVGRILAQSQAGLYVCRSCRHQLSRPSISVQHRFASTEEPRGTEKFKQRPWSPSDSTTVPNGRSGEIHTEKRPIQRHAEQDIPDRDTISRRTIQAQPTAHTQRSTGSDSTVETPEYVPSETWDGLEFVGSTGSWRDVPSQPSDDFSAWLDPNSLIAANRLELVSCLHQAMVECLTCNQAGLDPNSVLHMDSAQLDERTINAFASARITPSQPGQLSQVQFASDAQAKEVVELLAAVDAELKDGRPEIIPELHEETLVDAEAEVETEAVPLTIEADSVQPEQEHSTTSQRNSLNYRVRDESFLGLRLDMEDPVTFTVLKRFSQLAGHRIPDPTLNTLFSSNKSLSFLIEELDETVVQPKPKKIADILMNNSAISAKSNVLIFPRRETSVDKEKEVGRWKIIEKELQDRGLPTLGKLKL